MNLVFGVVAPDFECGQRHRHLEGRARRILSSDHLVGERGKRVAGERLPARGRKTLVELVGLEARSRGHGQHLARARVHEHGGGTALIRDALDEELLQAEVDAERHVPAGLALVARELADDPSARVHLDLRRADRAAQCQVVDLLGTHLADAEVRQLEQRIAIELLVGRRGHVSHDVGEGRAVRIIADAADLGAHAREIGHVDLDAGELLPAQVFAHRDGDEGAIALGIAEHAAPLGIRQGDDPSQAVEGGAQVAGVLRHDDDAVVLPIERHGPPEAVEDAPTRRRQEAQIDAVVLGKRLIPFRLQDLEIIHAGDEGREQRYFAAHDEGGTAAELLALELVELHRELSCA